MTFEIGQLAIAPAAAAPPAPTRAPGARPQDPVAPARAPLDVDASDLIPASPPPEVLAEVDAAWDRASRLAEENRELHFARDAETGRLIIEVRTLDGEVLRTIPPSEMLNVMSGSAL